MKNPQTGLDAYAEAWAVNFFLINAKPKQYQAYMQMLAEKKPLVYATPEERLAEAVRRANAYLAAGADCAFVPFVRDGEQIARLVREIKGPINILAKPGSLPLAELERLGVRRVSVGSAIALAAYGLARRAATELLGTGTYEAMRDAVPYAEMQELLGEGRASR